MPLYQTLVSYVQKMKLGGNNAPKADHPFTPYAKELIEFVELMGKLHSKMEEESNGLAAWTKILHCLKCSLFKTLRQVRLGSVAGPVIHATGRS
jgi:hypothetical protein